MDKKICSKCKIEKNYSEFCLKNNKPRSQCKECEKQYRLEKKEFYDLYYKNNKEKINNQRKTYRENNKEKISTTNKEYREKNKEKIKVIQKKYQKENKEKLSKNSAKRQKKYRENNKEKVKNLIKEWRSKNKEHIKEYVKKRYNSIPHIRVDNNISNAIRESLKKNKITKKQTWEKILGYTLKDLMDHLEKQFKNGMSWENYGPYWHIDHIKPKSLFNYSSYEDIEFKQCWALSNLQPLEAKENLIKNNKYMQNESMVQ